MGPAAGHGLLFPAQIPAALGGGAGVESRSGADHMRTAVCLPSSTGTCIVGRTDRGVIIETGDKL